MGGIADMATQMEEALKSGDYRRITELIQGFGTDDFVQEWPQSGERIVRENMLKLAEQYPEMSGTNPTFVYKRMLGGGNTFVIEGTVDYGDGIPVSYVGIGELREGRISRMTEYFANPFEAPAWRAPFVERMDAVSV